MYLNLKAEMARKNIKVKDIALLLGITGQAASAKLNSNSRITFNEALIIHDTLFPEHDLKTLFETA